jgi:hypothetical protein
MMPTFNASKDMNERAWRLGISVEVHIDITEPGFVPTVEQGAKMGAALNAAHMAILESLEATGFSARF